MVPDPAGQPASEKQRIGTNIYLGSPEYGTTKAPGYHTLASLMGRDGEYAIFRKFSSLNALSLMSLQAQLLELEQEYKDSLFDQKVTMEGVALGSCFRALHGSESVQKALLVQIQEKLDEYNQCFWKLASSS